MHMKLILGWIVGLAAAAAIGWYTMLAWIPGHASDVLWQGMLAKGARLNVLRTPMLRKAPEDIVPLGNADIVVRSSIYDLSNGPILFEANVPANLAYWSVSVFARNTDTLFVANDQKLRPGPFKLVVRRADQLSRVKANAEVVSPSVRGILMVRPVLANRADPIEVAKAMRAVADEKVSVLPAR